MEEGIVYSDRLGIHTTEGTGIRISIGNSAVDGFWPRWRYVSLEDYTVFKTNREHRTTFEERAGDFKGLLQQSFHDKLGGRIVAMRDLEIEGQEPVPQFYKSHEIVNREPPFPETGKKSISQTRPKIPNTKV